MVKGTGNMYHARVLVLTLSHLFFFLHHSVITFAVNFPTPSSPVYECRCCMDNNLATTNSVLWKLVLAFGRGNVIATVVIILITLLNIVVYKLRQLHEANLYEKLNVKPSYVSEQSCRRFSLFDIISATNHFDDALLIGRGGFGKVYKGIMDDGAITVAIKRLNPMSKQGAPEFWTEIDMLSKFRHSHIVSLIGYCDSHDEMILVYEYMVRGTLAEHLYRTGKAGTTTTSTLSWLQRLKICIGAAHGLDYLHTGTGIQHRVIHRDVKSSNILLDENWAAKISDFGLSKIGPTNRSCSQVSTKVKGTFGYLDPEYFLTHRLTRKSDVYAFGVVLFEVLCGRRALDVGLDVEQRGLAGWAQHCIKEGTLDQIIDPFLRGEIFSNSLSAFVQIADQCLHNFSKKRPSMAEVVASLENALALQERAYSALFNENIFTTSGDYDSQENIDSSIAKQELINDGNGGLHSEIIQLGDASGGPSRVKTAKIMTFRRMVQSLFLGMPWMNSVDTEPLPWFTRLNIAIGAARGLAFLQTMVKEAIYHQFQTSCILLDGDFNVKLWNFEFAGATSCSPSTIYVPTFIIGNYLYKDPEYWKTGSLTMKSDVYGFGLVLLDLLTGLSVFNDHLLVMRGYTEEGYLIFNERRLKRLMDRRLNGNYPLEGALQYVVLVQKCLHIESIHRPTMEEVLDTLEHINGIKMAVTFIREELLPVEMPWYQSVESLGSIDDLSGPR